MTSTRGIYKKYVVERIDGTPVGDSYFILRPDDAHGIAALAASPGALAESQHHEVVVRKLEERTQPGGGTFYGAPRPVTAILALGMTRDSDGRVTYAPSAAVRAALTVYAASCEAESPDLANDLRVICDGGASDPTPAPPGTEPVVDKGMLLAYRVTDPEAFFDALRPAVMRNLEHQDDAPRERAGYEWSGRLGGQCPVQGEGTVDGVPWYFRARGTTWSLAIAATPDGDPIEVDYLDVPIGAWLTRGESEGEGEFSASWMGYAEAWRHVEAAIAAYRAWCAELASVPTAERRLRAMRARLSDVETRRANIEAAMRDSTEAREGVLTEITRRLYDAVCAEQAKAQAELIAELSRAVADAKVANGTEA